MASAFLDLCNEFKISTPALVANIVQRSFPSGVYESVLFMALGHDYWFNPSDVKLSGLYQSFFMAGSTLELNIDQRARKQVSAFLFDPKISAHKENGEAVVIKTKGFGGVMDGGVANYNLCTKALDAAADGFEPNFKRGIQQGLSKATAGSNAPSRTLMVDCYNDLKSWWSSAELTRIGLTAR